jgi:hypothetical protein
MNIMVLPWLPRSSELFEADWGDTVVPQQIK